MHLVNSTEKEKQYVTAQLTAFNESKVPNTQFPSSINIDLVTKNDKRRVVGGAFSILYHWRILFIDILWVDEFHRGRGYGTALIKETEKRAKAMNCYLIHLDTFDFQAKAFYEKMGYEVFGVLSNCPMGHNRYFLKKEI